MPKTNVTNISMGNKSCVNGSIRKLSVGKSTMDKLLNVIIVCIMYTTKYVTNDIPTLFLLNNCPIDIE